MILPASLASLLTTGASLSTSLAWVSGAIRGVLMTLFVLAALFLILVILIQESKGGGIAGAFGGAAAETFGVKAGSVNRFTLILIAIFCGIALVHAGIPSPDDSLFSREPAAPTEPASEVPTVAPTNPPTPPTPPAMTDEPPAMTDEPPAMTDEPPAMTDEPPSTPPAEAPPTETPPAPPAPAMDPE